MLSHLPTNKLINIFKTLDLDTEHTLTYLANLKLGEASASSIAKETKLPRSSTYYLLEDLSKAGLVSVIEGETKKMFAAVEPDVIQHLLEESRAEVKYKQEELSTILPDLENLHLSGKGNFPKVSFYKGVSGLKKVLYDCFSAKIVRAYCNEILSDEKSIEDEPDYLIDFVEQIKFRNMRLKEIIYDNKVNREYAKRFRSDKHQMLIIPPGENVKFKHVDKQIYDNKIAYISHDNKIGVIIEDETLASAEISQFEDMWRLYSK